MPVRLRNKDAKYKISNELRAGSEQELQMWITNGWLIPYPLERLGSPKGLILLMAVVQLSKGKVCPIIDYRELNEHVDTSIVNVNMCCQVKGVALARGKCGPVRPMESLFAS